MTKEALKLALEAMEGADNIDVDMQSAIVKCKEALAQPVHKHDAAIKTLEHLKYTYHGGEYWKPPLGKVKALAQPEQTNTRPYYTIDELNAWADEKESRRTHD